MKQVAKVSDTYKKVNNFISSHHSSTLTFILQIPKVLDNIFDAISCICDKLCSIFEDSLSDENVQILEDIICMNQHLLSALDVSHPRIEEICNISKKIGDLPTKLTGGGGGGCTITCITPKNADKIDKFSDILTQLGFNCFKVYTDHNGVKLKIDHNHDPINQAS